MHLRDTQKSLRNRSRNIGAYKYPNPMSHNNILHVFIFPPFYLLIAQHRFLRARCEGEFRTYATHKSDTATYPKEKNGAKSFFTVKLKVPIPTALPCPRLQSGKWYLWPLDQEGECAGKVPPSDVGWCWILCENFSSFSPRSWPVHIYVLHGTVRPAYSN